MAEELQCRSPPSSRHRDRLPPPHGTMHGRIRATGNRESTAGRHFVGRELGTKFRKVSYTRDRECLPADMGSLIKWAAHLRRASRAPLPKSPVRPRPPPSSWSKTNG